MDFQESAKEFMETVKINDLQPDQIVAAPVTNVKGAVLCPAGFRLTEAAIDRLKRAGVETVYVESSPEEVRKAIEARLADLEARFARVEDPLLLEIRAAAERRLRYMLLEQDNRSA
jgi:hypothetical protein